MADARDTGPGGLASVRQIREHGEIERRLVHASGTGLPALYVLGLASWRQVGLLIAVGAVIAFVLEFLRLFVGLDWAIYDRLTREYEQDNVAGYALYFLSSAPVALLAPPEIGVPAVVMLTLGDPISGLLGSAEATTRKSPSVLAAMFLACLLFAIPFLPPVAAVLGALAATVADGAKPVIAGHVVDDNLTIPPAAASAMAVGVAIAPVV